MGSPTTLASPIASLAESCGIGAIADSASYLDAVSSPLPPSSINMLPRHQNTYVIVQLIDLDSIIESILGLRLLNLSSVLGSPYMPLNSQLKPSSALTSTSMWYL